MRIASVIRAVLAEAIRERLSDPRIEQMTSITHVDVSADLSVARVHVSVMAPTARQQLTLVALKHASGRLRTLVSKELFVRQTPQITFLLDESLQRGFETVQKIDQLMVELDGKAADDGAVAGDDEPAANASPRLAAMEADADDDERRTEDSAGRGAADSDQRDVGAEDT